MDACFAYLRAKTVSSRYFLTVVRGGASILHGKRGMGDLTPVTWLLLMVNAGRRSRLTRA